MFSLQFLILISRKSYRLQTRDITWKCLYVLQEVRSIIYFRQFIHPLSFRSGGNRKTFAFTSYNIVSVEFCNVTFLNNFYFVSLFYHLFICRRQRKIRLVPLSKSYSYKFPFYSFFLVYLSITLSHLSLFWTQKQNTQNYL